MDLQTAAQIIGSLGGRPPLSNKQLSDISKIYRGGYIPSDIPVPPTGFVLLIGDDGLYLLGDDGAYLYGYQ